MACFCSYDLSDEFKPQIQQEVCQDLPNYRTDEHGNNFCLLHYPHVKKKQAFFTEFYKRIETNNLNFNYVWFPGEISLWDFEFEGALSFQEAVFNKSLNFNNGKMMNAFFNGAKFLKAVNFGNVEIFGAVNFSGSTIMELFHFSNVTFHGNAKFWMIDLKSRLLFRNVRFYKRVSLERIDFPGIVNFEGNNNNEVFLGDDVILDFQLAKPENPDKFLFYKTRLNPSWFINVDCREFVLTDVDWKNVDNNFTKINVEAELKSLEKRGVENSKQLFKIACRQLAENSENNSRFEEASNFRRMAMETEWREKKEKLIQSKNLFDILRKFGEFCVHGLYRITSFYGESSSWAALILIIISITFTFYYHFAYFQICPKGSEVNTECVVRKMDWIEAIHQSSMTAALQNVEYRKALIPEQDLLILLQKILSPIQAALLLLAIRRKFMR